MRYEAKAKQHIANTKNGENRDDEIVAPLRMVRIQARMKFFMEQDGEKQKWCG